MKLHIYTAAMQPCPRAVVQCVYDGLRMWCAPGRGCKNPTALEAARRRVFRNRSKAQKRRWAAVRSNTALTGAPRDGDGSIEV